MIYNYAVEDLENWVVLEPDFDSRYLGKCEVIMALGNGYIGMRSATEERYVGEVRNTFIAGTFNRFDTSEVTELPNIADVFQIMLELGGERFDLTQGEILAYKRFLSLKTGELTRSLVWKSPNDNRYELTFKRFVSLNNMHLVSQQVMIKALDAPLELKVFSGIDGQMTNSGVQHFSEGERRLFNQDVLQFVQKTMESEIDVVVSSQHRFTLDDESITPKSLIQMDRRRIFFEYEIEANPNQALTLEKTSYFVTSRDLSSYGQSLDALRLSSVNQLSEASDKGYDTLLKESAVAWDESIWSKVPIHIESKNGFDQLAIRFAQYHLRIMTPVHDERMNIGAKGLTGEGYKGHTFWDTEIFMLPYYSYSQPDIARRLLTHRYLSLDGARQKAKENGYAGAMFPWESAWLDDGEVTPVWGAADIHTGESTKIWSGFIEQHITADVTFALWQYYQLTNDDDFMRNYGYEIVFDTAKFWSSRLEWSELDGLYHINQVVGPDEYKEHVDDNAFTNYLAGLNIKLAIYYAEVLKKKEPDLWRHLSSRLQLSKYDKEWPEKLAKLYLPKPNDDGIVPQDRTYLEKEIIDLAPYKTSSTVGTLFRHYNLDQVNQMQVSKQADVMILMYLLEEQFDQETKKANWDYYEPKTLHDSSLSLSTHAVMASDLGHIDMAYEFFQRAAAIDLGPNRRSSDHGIHAASLGGLWQSVVNGFGGVRLLNGRLRIQPHLPQQWQSLSFRIHWRGEEHRIRITSNEIHIEKDHSLHHTEVEVFGKYYVFNERMRILYGSSLQSDAL